MAEWSKQPESRGLPCAVAEPLSSGAAGHQLTAANSLKTHPLSWHPLQRPVICIGRKAHEFSSKPRETFLGDGSPPCPLPNLTMSRTFLQQIQVFIARPGEAGQLHPILDAQDRRPADDF